MDLIILLPSLEQDSGLLARGPRLAWDGWDEANLISSDRCMTTRNAHLGSWRPLFLRDRPCTECSVIVKIKPQELSADPLRK